MKRVLLLSLKQGVGCGGVYIVRLCGRHEIISTVILLNQEGLLSVTSETGFTLLVQVCPGKKCD